MVFGEEPSEFGPELLHGLRHLVVGVSIICAGRRAAPFAPSVSRDDLAGIGINASDESALGTGLFFLLIPESLIFISVGDAGPFVRLKDDSHKKDLIIVMSKA